MIECIEREELFKRINTGMGILDAMQEILDCPTVYMPDVVLCKDCKHYREEPSAVRPDDAVVVWCSADCYPTNRVMPDNWYCANGERRTQ